MTEPSLANTGPTIWVYGDVKDDVVRTRGIHRHSTDSGQRVGSGQVIQTQQVSDAPSDVVVSARSIATYTDSADDQMPRCVETKAAAEDVYAPNFTPLFDEASRLKALAVLAFCAEMARLPGHCAPRLTPEKATAHTTPSRFTSVAHI